MPSFPKHSNRGILVGALYGVARSLHHQKTGEEVKEVNWQKVLEGAMIGACGGFVGSMIPDVWNRPYIPIIVVWRIVSRLEVESDSSQ